MTPIARQNLTHQKREYNASLNSGASSDGSELRERHGFDFSCDVPACRQAAY